MRSAPAIAAVATIQRVQALTASRARYEIWHDDPVAWLHDCIRFERDEKPAPYQNETLARLVAHGREAVRGPHGLGKTADGVWALLWFATTREFAGEDWKVPVTASAWRQLVYYFWPEVHKWCRRLNWHELARPPFRTEEQLMRLRLKLDFGEAFALASNDPDLIEGAHASQLLYILDEARAIADPIWEAVEGAFSQAGTDTKSQALALAFSTPGEPMGTFYRIHKRQAGYEDWLARHITLEEALNAGRISQVWVNQRRLQWGETSAVFQRRVLGEFATSEEDSIIPLAWIEAAVERWYEWDRLGRPGAVFSLGVDCARTGEDAEVLAPRFVVEAAGGRPRIEAIGDLESHAYTDNIMQTAGRVLRAVTRWPGVRPIIDVVGLGAGVVDRSREQGIEVEAFNAGAGTDARDQSGELGFLNVRAASWWGMRERLDPAGPSCVALPPDDQLLGDLTAPKWDVTSAGKIRVESKDDIKKRLGRSPDKGDAVVMAFWSRPPRIRTSSQVYSGAGDEPKRTEELPDPFWSQDRMER